MGNDNSQNEKKAPLKDVFYSYREEKDPVKRERSYAWHTAVGLQAVDGLRTSDFLKETAVKNIEGEITVDEALAAVEEYYKGGSKPEKHRQEEADRVSARIVAELANGEFEFSVSEYISIHKRLFEGVYNHAGKIRNYNIAKREWVLEGDTVVYGRASKLRGALEECIKNEKDFDYSALSDNEKICRLADFVSGIWQVHIFDEGNTRTTAIFLIKYLKSLGYDVSNDVFAENAWYFRNALVRANYNDPKKGIYETDEFLLMFLRNFILGENNNLRNRSTHIRHALKENFEK